MGEKPENITSVDQKIAEVRLLLGEYVGLFSQTGSVQKSWRSHRGHRLGPFFRLAFRVNGKQNCLYLGSNTVVAAKVSELLRKLQSPLREQRALRREQARIRVVFRVCKQTFDQELRAIGLFLKGNEIRGWRRCRANGLR